MNRNPRVISISSGKGGVGKSNITINLALALMRAGRKALIWDADLGLANIDVLLGLNPEFNFQHVLNGKKELREIMETASCGLKILPAGSGLEELTHLSLDQKVVLGRGLQEITQEFDYILFDTGAGIASNVIYFNKVADEVILVVVPEPTSITDSYAMIKVMSQKHGRSTFKILMNLVKGEVEAGAIFNRIRDVAERFLSIRLDYYGFIPRDEAFSRSVIQQKPLLELYPNSPASRCIEGLARTIDSNAPTPGGGGDRGGSEPGGVPFYKRLLEQRTAML